MKSSGTPACPVSWKKLSQESGRRVLPDIDLVGLKSKVGGQANCLTSAIPE
jgi:hypothetical protein